MLVHMKPPCQTAAKLREARLRESIHWTADTSPAGARSIEPLALRLEYCQEMELTFSERT